MCVDCQMGGACKSGRGYRAGVGGSAWPLSMGGRDLEKGAGLQGWGRGLCMHVCGKAGGRGLQKWAGLPGWRAEPLDARVWFGRWAGPGIEGGATGWGRSLCMCVGR